MKYYLIAGEASGDLHASNLMQSIREKDRHAEFRFLGGDLMASASGVEPTIHYREMAFMGFIPVLMNAGKILENLKRCKQDIVDFNPDAVILIDYPGFNLKIAKYVKNNLDIPVFYYISPKVWAWKEHRVKLFKKYVDVMLSILPFEVDFYKKHNYPVRYVGNPTVDAIAVRPFQEETFQEFTHRNSLGNSPIIALLAGSRKQEITSNLPAMLEALDGFSGYQLVIAGAPGIEPEFYNQFSHHMPLHVISGQTYRILSQSRIALVTSGTATLETALLDVPQVVCYKTSFPRISYWGFKNLLHTRYISLVNLICDKKVVKELFASLFTTGNLRDEISRILSDDGYRQKMMSDYEGLREVLGKPGASKRAAEIVVDELLKRRM